MKSDRSEGSEGSDRGDDNDRDDDPHGNDPSNREDRPPVNGGGDGGGGDDPDGGEEPGGGDDPSEPDPPGNPKFGFEDNGPKLQGAESDPEPKGGSGDGPRWSSEYMREQREYEERLVEALADGRDVTDVEPRKVVL